MKTLIAYSTRTGNTEKVAKAVAGAFEAAEVKDISEVENLEGYSLVVVGTWIDKATADAKAMGFIEKIQNRDVAFFYTLGAYPDSDHAADCTANITKLFEKNGNRILGSYHCQGAIDPKLMEWMSKLPEDHPHAPDEARRKRWADAALHPDENDLLQATKNFENILNNR